MSGASKWGRRRGLFSALILLTVGAYVLLFHYLPWKEQREYVQGRLFTNTDGASLLKVRLDSPGGHFEFSCKDTSKTDRVCTVSQLKGTEKPVVVTADPLRVSELVEILYTLPADVSVTLKDKIPQERETVLKSYSLDQASLAAPDAVHVMIETTAGKTQYYIGNRNSVDYRAAALVESVPTGQELKGRPNPDNIYFVTSNIVHQFNYDIEKWRDHAILRGMPLERITALSLAVQRRGVEVTYEKNSAGTWNLSMWKGPAGDFLNTPSAAIGVLTQLTEWRFLSIAAEDKATVQDEMRENWESQVRMTVSDSDLKGKVEMELWRSKVSLSPRLWLIVKDRPFVYEMHPSDLGMF